MAYATSRKVDYLTTCSEFAGPANQHPKRTIKKRKKSTTLCASREFLKHVSAMFDNHKVLLLFN